MERKAFIFSESEWKLERCFLMERKILYYREMLYEIELTYFFLDIRVFFSQPKDKIEKIDSIAPEAPNKWPVDDLVDDINNFFLFFSKIFFTELNSISSPKRVEVPWALI